MICADSMHSKEKVRTKYPQVNKNTIEQLYGRRVKGLRRTMWDLRKTRPKLFNSIRYSIDDEYRDLNLINLTKFYRETAPGRDHW